MGLGCPLPLAFSLESIPGFQCSTCFRVRPQHVAPSPFVAFFWRAYLVSPPLRGFRFLRKKVLNFFPSREGGGGRQPLGWESFAPETYPTPAVLEAQGSVLTNKYAEGY